MLEPTARLLYLTELRPPPGYSLDRALATTFSLDLVSLLMAPVSMAVLELDSRQRALADPVAVLEALRRTAGRFAVFCQQGHICVPQKESLLYSYLESSVVEVRPPKAAGVFHPKTWLLRFTCAERPVVYRFLCLSRNLTQDRSWDTALVLEGELEDRTYAFSRNHPLGDFVQALPELAVLPMSDAARKHATLMSDEVRRVRFTTPEPFRQEGSRDALAFAPIGLRGIRTVLPSAEGCARQMVISPFLSGGQVSTLAEHGSRNVLISRTNSLDALSDAAFHALESNGTDIYAMDDGAENPDEVLGYPGGTGPDEGEDGSAGSYPGAASVDAERRFAGLHAKLYCIERGARDVSLWTGSANATEAAFGGANVEFLVELRGRRRDIGIDQILGAGNGQADGTRHETTCLRDLLRPYVRPSVARPENAARDRAEKLLEVARRAVAEAGLRIVASGNISGAYRVALRTSGPGPSVGADVRASCFLVTLGKATSRDATGLFSGRDVVFPEIAAPDLSRLVGFQLAVRCEGQELSTSFVLNLLQEGFPEDRDVLILSSILGDGGKFLRYLLFLLTEEEGLEVADALLESPAHEPGAPFQFGALVGMPLFEQLVRAFSRSPEKIDRADDLVRDLLRADAGREVVPEEFLALWEAFRLARRTEAAT